MPPAKSPTRRAIAPLPKCSELEDLLGQRNEQPARHREIDREITRRFQRKRAVLILDMAGFSLSVQRHGIIHHLAKIHRMCTLVAGEVGRARGSVVKFEADNAFATFGTVQAAVKAAIAINRRVVTTNQATPEADHIQVAIGIGYGPILLACDDFYGDEVNLASKLGEDIADHGEVLLTAAARKALRGGKHRFKPFSLTISGVHLQASRLQY